MKKKLLAVAVVGAFALPGAALAQSSVTISGFFKGGFESQSYGQSLKNPKGQSGVVDDSSRLVFNVREDLGGGLAAIGQIDIRFKLDDPGAAAAASSSAQNTINLSGGNTHVGLVSKNWGRILLGRQDLHYFNRESELTVRGSLRADSISILAFAGGAGTAIAGATRTQNVVHYTTPNWNGFTTIVAYSSSPLGTDSDLGNGIRKGKAWNINPNWAQKNFQIGYSYWSSKPDGASTTTCPAGTFTVVNGAVVAACGAGGVTTVAAANQRSDRLYGSYNWGGLKVGLAWDRSKIDNAITGANTSNRSAWSVPAQYRWGNHGVYGHYSKARDDKATAANDGAKMWALSYAYDISKRTSASVTYAKITNDAGAVYRPFTDAALGVGGAIAAGEDPRLWGVTLRHAF